MDINSIVFAGRTLELDKKAFQSCETEKIVITGCDMVIGENAFSYCEDVTEVIISGSNIEVETYAFYDTGKDMNVKIINCTGVLDEKAFQSCGIGDLNINVSDNIADNNNPAISLGTSTFFSLYKLYIIVEQHPTGETLTDIGKSVDNPPIL